MSGEGGAPCRKKASGSGSSYDTNRSSKNYFGINIKRDYDVGQFLSIPLVNTAGVMVGVYMNAQMAYMLED